MDRLIFSNFRPHAIYDIQYEEGHFRIRKKIYLNCFHINITIIDHLNIATGVNRETRAAFLVHLLQSRLHRLTLFGYCMCSFI